MKGSSSNDADLMENSEDEDYDADLNDEANNLEADHELYEDEEEFSVNDTKKEKKNLNGNDKQSKKTSNKTHEIANKVQQKAKKVEKQAKCSRVKKGYATSKQRLSKILKLNRIIHF
jgi:hypothetical protein